MNRVIAVFQLALVFMQTDAFAECRDPRGGAKEAEAAGSKARTLARAGAYDEAERLFKQSLETYEGCLAPQHILARHARFRLGKFYDRRGRLDEAEQLLKRNLELAEGSQFPGQYIDELAAFYEDHQRSVTRMDWPLASAVMRRLWR